jgi:hypothetical protein
MVRRTQLRARGRGPRDEASPNCQLIVGKSLGRESPSGRSSSRRTEGTGDGASAAGAGVRGRGKHLAVTLITTRLRSACQANHAPEDSRARRPIVTHPDKA